MERQFILEAKSGSNIQIDKQQIKANFSSSEILLNCNGDIISYDDQRLTMNGLQIMKERDGNSMNSVLQFTTSIQLDEKVKDHKYCIQIARSLDRASNSASIIAEKQRKKTEKSYTLQICQFLVKKIPRKPICFLTVFRNLKVQKIKVLLEGNSFFLEIFKYLCDVIYKVNIDEFIVDGKQNTQGKVGRKLFTQPQKKLSYLYREVMCQMRKYPFAHQRISILIQSLFTYPSNIANFLNKINQALILQIVDKETISLFGQCDKAYHLIATPVSLILENLNLMIKNTFFYISKSCKAFEMLDNIIAQSLQLQQWLSHSIQQIRSDHYKSELLIQLLTWLFEINKKRANLIYSLNFQNINQIIKNEIQISYENICQFINQSYYQSEISNKQLSIESLNNLKVICSLTINLEGKAGNIGVVICRYLCQIASKLKAQDIQLLTYACCSNQYSRPYLLKFLIQYFEAFIRRLKSKIKNSSNSLKIKEARKQKHILLAIIQSIINISIISSIQQLIQKDFFSDLLSILQTGRFCPKSNLVSFSLGCIGSTYLSLMNKIQQREKHDKITY